MANESESSITEPKADPSISDILAFDPFAPPKETPPAGETSPTEGEAAPTPPGEVKAGETEGVASPKGEAKTPPTSPPVPPTPPLDAARLERAIADQTAAIRQALQPKEAAPAAPGPAAPRFNLGLPPQLIKALRSEDEQEFGTGMHALVNGIANHIWNNVMEMVTKDLLPSVPRLVEGHYSTMQKQQEVATDFYGKYPQLNTPTLKPLVQNVGVQLANEWAASGKAIEWNDEFREAIAERIFQHIPALKVVAVGSNGATPPGRKQPFVAGGGARPAVPKGGPENEMLEILKA